MSGKKTIVTLLRVSLLACPLLFTTPSFAMIDTPSVKVGFSPEGSASALVLDTINSAESSIRMIVNAKIIGRFSPFLMSAIGH